MSEKMACSGTIDVICLLPKQLRVHIDVQVMSSRCHSAKAQSAKVCYTTGDMVTDKGCHLTYDSRGAWHILYAMLPSSNK